MKANHIRIGNLAKNRRVETHKDLMKTDKKYAEKFNKCIS